MPVCQLTNVVLFTIYTSSLVLHDTVYEDLNWSCALSTCTLFEVPVIYIIYRRLIGKYLILLC